MAGTLRAAGRDIAAFVRYIRGLLSSWYICFFFALAWLLAHGKGGKFVSGLLGVALPNRDIKPREFLVVVLFLFMPLMAIIHRHAERVGYERQIRRCREILELLEKHQPIQPEGGPTEHYKKCQKLWQEARARCLELLRDIMKR